MLGIPPGGHHDVLQATAQRDLYGHLELGRHLDQLSHRPQHTRDLAFTAGHRDGLHAREEPGAALVHAAEHLQPRVGVTGGMAQPLLLALARLDALPYLRQLHLQRRDALGDFGNLRGIGQLHFGSGLGVATYPGHALRPLGDSALQPLLLRRQGSRALLQGCMLPVQLPLATIGILPGASQRGQLLLEPRPLLTSRGLLPRQERRVLARFRRGALQVAQIHGQPRQVGGDVRHLLVQAKPRIIHIRTAAPERLDASSGEVPLVNRPVQPLGDACTTRLQVREARPHLVRRHPGLLELLRQGDYLAARGRRRVVRRDGTRLGCGARGGHAGPRCLVVRALERQQAVTQTLPLTRLLRRALQGAQAWLQLHQEIGEPRHVGVCLGQVPLCLGHLQAQARQVRGVLEEPAPLFRAQAECGIDQPLPDHHMAVPETRGELRHILQADPPAIDEVVILARPEGAPRNRHLGELGRQPAFAVVEHERGLRHPGGSPSLPSGEDHLFRLAGAQRRLALLTQDPAQGIRDV